MQACHRRKAGAVLHRDLKPANVFLDRDYNAKLGDFGLARVLESSTTFARTFVGTPYYMSPEQMCERGYNEKSDIWSLGCLLYEMAALQPPFNAPNQARLAVKIREGTIKRLPAQYSSALNALCASMLQKEPSRRPAIRELVQSPALAETDSAPQEKPAPAEPELAPATLVAAKAAPDDELQRREAELRRRDAELQQRESELRDREAAVRAREQVLEEREKAAQRRDLATARRSSTPTFDRLRDDGCGADASAGGRRLSGLDRSPLLPLNPGRFEVRRYSGYGGIGV